MDQAISPVKETLKPNMMRFSNVIAYLKAEFDYRKSLDAAFSLDQWCAELGFKSRSFMYMVLSKKRSITPAFIDLFAKHMKFTEVEKNFFALLAYYENAETACEKKIYLDKILESMETNAVQIELKNHLEFLSDLDLPVIKLLLAFDDVKGSAKEVSSLLDYELAIVDTQFKKLEAMGLIRTTDGIHYKATDKAFVTKEDYARDVVKLFHQKTTEEAFHKVSTPDFGRFRTIYFTVSEEQQKILLDEMELFLTKMKNKFGSDTIQDKKLIKMNLQAYSVTE